MPDARQPVPPKTFSQEQARQAIMVGFVNAFDFIVLSFVVLAPPAFLARGKQTSTEVTAS